MSIACEKGVFYHREKLMARQQMTSRRHRHKNNFLFVRLRSTLFLQEERQVSWHVFVRKLSAKSTNESGANREGEVRHVPLSALFSYNFTSSPFRITTALVTMHLMDIKAVMLLLERELAFYS